jgi:cell division protein FtsZ
LAKGPEAEAPHIEIVKKPVEIDYDEPTVIRQGKDSQTKKVANGDINMDYLDIPAFLRRQAD